MQDGRQGQPDAHGRRLARIHFGASHLSLLPSLCPHTLSARHDRCCLPSIALAACDRPQQGTCLASSTLSMPTLAVLRQSFALGINDPDSPRVTGRRADIHTGLTPPSAPLCFRRPSRTKCSMTTRSRSRMPSCRTPSWCRGILRCCMTLLWPDLGLATEQGLHSGQTATGHL